MLYQPLLDRPSRGPGHALRSLDLFDRYIMSWLSLTTRFASSSLRRRQPSVQGYSLRESLEASDGNRYSRLGEGHVHKWCFRCEPPSSGTPGAADRSTYYNNRHDAQGGKRKEREKRGMGEHHTTDNGPPTQTSHNRTLLTQRENIEGSHLYNRQHTDTAHTKALITHRHMFTVTTRVCASLLPSRKVFYPAFPEKAGRRHTGTQSQISFRPKESEK